MISRRTMLAATIGGALSGPAQKPLTASTLKGIASRLADTLPALSYKGEYFVLVSPRWVQIVDHPPEDVAVGRIDGFRFISQDPLPDGPV